MIQAQNVDIDGDQWFISDGGCVVDPTSVFVSDGTLLGAVEKWNARKDTAKLTLQQAEDMAG